MQAEAPLSFTFPHPSFPPLPSMHIQVYATILLSFSHPPPQVHPSLPPSRSHSSGRSASLLPPSPFLRLSPIHRRALSPQVCFAWACGVCFGQFGGNWGGHDSGRVRGGGGGGKEEELDECNFGERRSGAEGDGARGWTPGVRGWTPGVRGWTPGEAT